LQREQWFFGAFAALPPTSPADRVRFFLGRPGLRAGVVREVVGVDGQRTGVAEHVDRYPAAARSF
jgi:hypothetical protein